jgi:molybdopterin molybdotransferase
LRSTGSTELAGDKMSPVDSLMAERAAVLAPLNAVAREELPLEASAGRWLAEPAYALVPSPPCACSAMDGYAVRAAEVALSGELEVRRVVYAGDPPGNPLAPGEAVRVFTGAPLPRGADAVVRQESVLAKGDRALFRAAAKPGDNVRPEGEDVAQGGLALEMGVRLGPRQRALLRSVGVGRVRVRRRPKVLVLSTGDEVVSGRVLDSNGLAVAGLCEAAGAEVLQAQAPDRSDALRAALASATADLVLTIGGVSVGDRDLVPSALAALGADVRVHGVSMRPGRPFLFALLGGRPVLGLPGSPSACLVAFEVFARPALLALCGAARLVRRALPVRLAAPVAGHPDRARLLWAALDPAGRARPLGRRAGQVRGPAVADALLVLQAGTGELAEGSEAIAWLLDEGW